MPRRADLARIRSTPRLAGMPRAGGLAGLRASQQLADRRDFAWLIEGWVPPTAPGPATEREAMGLPAFGRGVNLLASTVAGVPWWAMRWDADLGVDVRLPDQPAVLTKPNPLTTVWHYKYAAIEDLILYGNHLAINGDLDYRTGRPGWIVPIPADEIWVMIDPNNGLFQFTVQGVQLDPDEVTHISAGNRSGEVLGRGVLRQYGEALGSQVATEEHTGGYFAGGALPPAVLQAPQPLTQAQGDELKAKWRTMTSDREPVILPTGYVLTPLVSNAEQAQLVQSRQWNAQASAMILGIPPWLLGLEGPTMTYQNVESADIAFVRDSVDRWTQPLSAVFSDDLMPNGTTVAWDYTSRLRGDSATTATVLSTLISAGVLTVDEGRAWLGRPPLDDVTDPGSTPEGVPELTGQEVTA